MVDGIMRGSAWVMLALAAVPAAAQQTVTLPARDAVLKQAPTEVFSIGTVDGRDWEMFSQIRGVAFDRSDNLYLLDGQNLRVIVFDAQGQYLRQFGRKGGGPGEFQAPLGLDVAADGSVVVSDLGNRAFIVFTPAGEHVRNVPFNDQLGFPLGFTADRRGGVIARVNPRIRPDQPPAGAGHFSTIFRQLIAGAQDAAPHALYQLPVTPPRILENSSSGGQRRVASVSMDPVFSARPSFGALPAGLAVHHTSEYDVRILDDNGRHVRTLTRHLEPRKVTKRDQDAWHERRRENERSGAGPTTIVMAASPSGSSVSIGGAGGGASPRPMTFNMDDVQFAEFMSVISSIRTDPVGRIWIQRRHEDGTNAGPIDLVTADGHYIGTLPPQELPRAVSASGRAAWVETDDLGVERVVVRKLPDTWLAR